MRWQTVRAAAALLAFVGGTIALPAAHVYDHWNDHFHTASGVVYVDGRPGGPASLDEVLGAITQAAFGGVGAHGRDVLNDPDDAANAHRHVDPGSEGPPPAPQERHGKGDGLHFGLALHGQAARFLSFTFTTLLETLSPARVEGLASAGFAGWIRIRGPPAQDGAFEV